MLFQRQLLTSGPTFVTLPPWKRTLFHLGTRGGGGRARLDGCADRLPTRYASPDEVRRGQGARAACGLPPALTPQQQQEARERRDNGATLSELAKSYNVGMATISRLSKKIAA